jgi:hypothetical protein
MLLSLYFNLLKTIGILTIKRLIFQIFTENLYISKISSRFLFPAPPILFTRAASSSNSPEVRFVCFSFRIFFVTSSSLLTALDS